MVKSQGEYSWQGSTSVHKTLTACESLLECMLRSEEYHSHNSNLTLGLFILWDMHCSTWTAVCTKLFLRHHCDPFTALVTAMAEDAACLSHSRQPSTSPLLPLHFCLAASAPSTVNCHTCYCAVSVSPSSLTKPVVLSCVNHLSNDIPALRCGSLSSCRVQHTHYQYRRQWETKDCGPHSWISV